MRIVAAAGMLFWLGLAGTAWSDTGVDLKRACEKDAEACLARLKTVAAQHAETEVCPPHDYRPTALRDAYLEWAQASDADILGRTDADQAALSALKEVFSCDE